MTISSTTRIAGPFTGNGVTTTFPFAYKVFDAADVQVIRLTISTGLETTLTIVTDYTISLNSDQDSNPGGNIVTVSPLAALYKLTATSDIANLQPTDLTNQGGFFPEVITDALDRATIQIQQMADMHNRTLMIPISDGAMDMELPNTSLRINTILGFDATGLPTVVIPQSSSITGNTVIVGTLGVTDAATLSSTLGVTGAATLSSTLGVTGAATLSSTLGVTGAATLSSTLGVIGAATLSSTLGVTGAATFSSTDYIKIPVGTIAQRPASPAAGQIRMNSDLFRPEWYSTQSSEWFPFSFDFNYGTQKAIFGYGYTGANVSLTNLVSNTGVVASDTTGVGTARYLLAAAGYGTDKAIFGYGFTGVNVSMTNLVSNTGVVATDTIGVGTARYGLAAAGYGTDKAIFGYGTTGSVVSMTNLVSNIGVVASDTTGVGTARNGLAAAGYGTDKAIFGYGFNLANVSMTNLVSNTGVVATDTTGVGTARYYLAAAGYAQF